MIAPFLVALGAAVFSGRENQLHVPPPRLDPPAAIIKVDGVLDKAETPTGPGLWFMDSSSAAAEMVTLCAAAGYAVHFFPTGQGNVIGNPILPVIKLCANPRTVRTMSEHIDVDVSGLLRKEMSPDQAGDKLLECMFRTANGRLTAAEALGHRSYILLVLGFFDIPSAGCSMVSMPR